MNTKKIENDIRDIERLKEVKLKIEEAINGKRDEVQRELSEYGIKEIMVAGKKVQIKQRTTRSVDYDTFANQFPLAYENVVKQTEGKEVLFIVDPKNIKKR